MLPMVPVRPVETGYQRIIGDDVFESRHIGSTFTERDDSDQDDTTVETGVIIHVVEPSRSRWNHIVDLDPFFECLYEYHQRHGFYLMTLQRVFNIIIYIFTVCFVLFITHFVNYTLIFANDHTQRLHLSDVIYSLNDGIGTFYWFTWLCVVVAIIVLLAIVAHNVKRTIKFWDIKQFYNCALKIADGDLSNKTWYQVQLRIREVQPEHKMCIHKTELSDLDIYHRILRKKNYLVAMINKNLFAFTYRIPFTGVKCVYMSSTMELSLNYILQSAFESNWRLKDEFKIKEKRHELAAQLQRWIRLVIIFNVCIAPFVFIWTFFEILFQYGELMKREPGRLGARRWSAFAQLRLRHFNELHHELHARLRRAYRPAQKYMATYSSPLLDIVAKFVIYLMGAVFIYLFALTIVGEVAFFVDHIIFYMAVSTTVIATCYAMIPDENQVTCPQFAFTATLAHIHYIPDHWVREAHTQRTRDEFAQFFQYTAVYLLETLFSAILTPYHLFEVQTKALDIVDFLRNFTVTVQGVGDVCSFAIMDVKKHGHPDWQLASDDVIESNQYTRAEEGKTELSLIHFAMTNPQWKLPTHATKYMSRLRTTAQRDANSVDESMQESQIMASSRCLGYQSLAEGVLQSVLLRNGETFDGDRPSFTNRSGLEPSVNLRGVSRTEGPIYPDDIANSMMCSGNRFSNNPSMAASMVGLIPSTNPGDFHLQLPRVVDMSVSTLYLHDVHQRQIQRRGAVGDPAQRSMWQRPHQASGVGASQAENTPLLIKPR